MIHRPSHSLAAGALFVFVFACVFLVPLSPVAWHSEIYGVLYTAMFFAAALALRGNRKLILGVAVGLTVVHWVAEGLQLSLLTAAANVLNLAFFLFMVSALILQIVRTREVDAQVILAAINGYLLLGLASSMAFGVVESVMPGSFGFSSGTGVSEFSEIVYFGFVTLTTVGYGEIVPQEPHARSLANFVGVIGQMYIGIIIALLVGKFAATQR